MGHNSNKLVLVEGCSDRQNDFEKYQELSVQLKRMCKMKALTLGMHQPGFEPVYVQVCTV